MTTEEWLKRGWKLNNEINSLIEEKEKALALACSVTAPTDHERITATRRNSSEERFISYAYEEYEKKINSLINALYQIKLEIASAISLVEDSALRNLLIKRYLQFKTWEQIATEMNYSCRQIVRLHEKALREVKMS